MASRAARAQAVPCAGTPSAAQLHAAGLVISAFFFFFSFNSDYFSPMILFSLLLIICLGEMRWGTAQDLYCSGFLGGVGHNLTFN